MPETTVPVRLPRHVAGGETSSAERDRALLHAAEYARQAPATRDPRPWRIDVLQDRVLIRADRSRRPGTPDSTAREVVQSAGAAVFDLRVALAEEGWAAEVVRLPDVDDPDLLAEVRPVDGPPDAALVALAPAVTRQATSRRRFTGGHVPGAVLGRLTEIAETECVALIPVVNEGHRRLVVRLIQQAEGLRHTGSAYRTADGPRMAAHAGPDRPRPDQAPDQPAPDQPMVLLATRSDDPLAWLHAGEALEHVRLELARLGWVADPQAQVIEVPLTRTQLRAALTWDAHPQILLRIGPAARAPRLRAI